MISLRGEVGGGRWNKCNFHFMHLWHMGPSRSSLASLATTTIFKITILMQSSTEFTFWIFLDSALLYCISLFLLGPNCCFYFDFALSFLFLLITPCSLISLCLFLLTHVFYLVFIDFVLVLHFHHSTLFELPTVAGRVL